MKRRAVFAVLIALILVSTATNLWSASIILHIDGNSSGPLPTFVEDGVFVIGTPTSNGHTFTAGGPNGGSIHVSGALDPDPEIVFASAATDLGNPSTFGYSFILPLAPQVTNPSSVDDSFAGGVTNGSGAGDVTVTAGSTGGLPTDGDVDTELMQYWLSDDNMGSWTNVGLDLAPSDTVAANSAVSTPWGVFSGGPISAPFASGPWTHMRVDLNFGLSGGGDIFNFTGRASLVPEPGTFMLALLGISAACGLGRYGTR